MFSTTDADVSHYYVKKKMKGKKKVTKARIANRWGWGEQSGQHNNKWISTLGGVRGLECW